MAEVAAKKKDPTRNVWIVTVTTPRAPAVYVEVPGDTEEADIAGIAIPRAEQIVETLRPGGDSANG